jgi:hypothetical protein
MYIRFICEYQAGGGMVLQRAQSVVAAYVVSIGHARLPIGCI